MTDGEAMRIAVGVVLAETHAPVILAGFAFILATIAALRQGGLW